LAKIAVELDRACAQRAQTGAPGGTTARVLAQGRGWSVADLLCTCGPRDRRFEEQHSHICIALIACGSFQYRSAAGRELLTPGSLLLGNAGQHFECGHEHSTGDRCLAFWYTPDHFQQIAAAAGTRLPEAVFPAVRIPPLRELSPVFAQACAGLAGLDSGLTGYKNVSWEELSVRLAAQAMQLVEGRPREAGHDAPSTLARVTRAVRAIDHDPAGANTLGDLAREARLSPYHFLRTFESLTGLTPHQYVLRTRLRQAAMGIAAEPAKILDIALDCGFGDVSNFVRAFRAEFGISPRTYRRQQQAGLSQELQLRR
jgi:AraC family transcriptional regulator